MKFFFADEKKNKNIFALLRRAGYAIEKNTDAAKSFARPLGYSSFPRFHIYLNETNDGWEINLHLDQKRPSYEGSSAHAGEYEGGAVEKEAERLKQDLTLA